VNNCDECITTYARKYIDSGYCIWTRNITSQVEKCRESVVVGTEEVDICCNKINNCTKCYNNGCKWIVTATKSICKEPLFSGVSDPSCCAGKSNCDNCMINGCKWCKNLCYNQSVYFAVKLPEPNCTAKCDGNCTQQSICSACVDNPFCYWNVSKAKKCDEINGKCNGTEIIVPTGTTTYDACNLGDIQKLETCNDVPNLCFYDCYQSFFTQKIVLLSDQLDIYVSNLNLQSSELVLSGTTYLITDNITFSGNMDIKISGDSYINATGCVIFKSKTIIQVEKGDENEKILFNFQCVEGFENVEINDASCSNGLRKIIFERENQIGVAFVSCEELVWWYYLAIGIISLLIISSLIVIFGVKSVREKIFPHRK